MRENPLSGRWLLLVEDEPVHAVQLRQALEEAGASVAVARCTAAKVLVERPELSAVVLDCHPNLEDRRALVQSAKERGLPVLFLGDIEPDAEMAGYGVPFVYKRSPTEAVVAALVTLLVLR